MKRPSPIHKKLQRCRRLLLWHIFAQGLLKSLILITLGVGLSLLLEITLWLPSWGRAFLYFSCLGLALAVGIVWIAYPLWKNARELTPETLAKYIGKQIPSMKDLLVNFLQLSLLPPQNPLVAAGITRREKWLNSFHFIRAIPWKSTRRYGLIIILIILIISIVSAIAPPWMHQGATRIVRYQTPFAKPLPFAFDILNKPLSAFAFEPFTLQLRIHGNHLPKEVLLVTPQRRIPMQIASPSEWTASTHFYRYEFPLYEKENTRFYFQADQYASPWYELPRRLRASLQQVTLIQTFPAYTRLATDTLRELRHMDIPEGTRLSWKLQSPSANALYFVFSPKDTLRAQKNETLFVAEKQFFQTSDYHLFLQNAYGQQKENLHYTLRVRKDTPPQIFSEHFVDTLFYRSILLQGQAIDDYGIRAMQIEYEVLPQATPKSTSLQKFPLPFENEKNARQQVRFFQTWTIDSLSLKEGYRLRYRVIAWDNHAIRGYQKGASPWFEVAIPSQQQQKERVQKQSQQHQKALGNAQESHQALQEEISDLQERLRTQKELQWPTQQRMEALHDKRKDLQEKLQTLQKENELLQARKEQQSDLSAERKEEMDRLQALIETLSEEKYLKLYEELEKLIQQSTPFSQVQEQLNKIQSQENRLQSEYERMMEWLKQLDFSLALQEMKTQIQSIKKNQETILKRTQSLKKAAKDAPSKASSPLSPEKADSLAKAQKTLRKALERLRTQEKALDSLSKTLKMPPQSIPFQAPLRERVKKSMQDSENALKKGENATPPQQKAQKGLEKMLREWKNFEANMQKEQINIDITATRKWLYNLIELSQEEEDIESLFAPSHQTLRQQEQAAKKQYDLQRAAASTLDSIGALATRSFKAHPMIHETLHGLQENLNRSLTLMRERSYSKSRTAIYESMMGFNTLALFLQTLLDKLQQQRSLQQGKGQDPIPNLSEWQEQLMEQLQELKRSGKEGESLSEELVRIIAQQEALRKAYESLMQDPRAREKDRKDLLRQLQDVERALANKKIDEALIKKQKAIQTRLLEIENATREQDPTEKREAEKRSPFSPLSPPTLKRFSPRGEEEVALKRHFLPLNKYYEKEVKAYFQRLQENREEQGE